MQMPSVPKLRVPNRYVPGTPDLEVPLPELNSGRSMNTMPRVFTDPLLNTRVRNYYRSMYEQNVANEIGGRVVGGAIGAGIGAGAGSVIGATVAGLGTLISLAIPGDFGAISAASIAAGAKLGFNIGAGVGAAGGIIGGDYSTWYATGDLLRNTAGKIFINPAEGILNSLYAVGKSMDIIQGGEALRASLYSLAKGGNVGENILKAYGLHSSGRQDYDFERIREELGIDLGTFPNFVVDFLGDVLTDPGFVASVTKMAFSKSAVKNISEVLKSNDEIINILKTSDALEKFSTTLSKNDSLLKQVSKAILNKEYDTIAYLVASNTAKSIDIADGNISKLLQKFVDETRKEAMNNVTGVLWDWGKYVDDYDDFLTGKLFSLALPPVGAIRLFNRTKAYIQSPDVYNASFKAKFNYWLFGNKANWSYTEQFAEGLYKHRSELVIKAFGDHNDTSKLDVLEGMPYETVRDYNTNLKDLYNLKYRRDTLKEKLTEEELQKIEDIETNIEVVKDHLQISYDECKTEFTNLVEEVQNKKDELSKLSENSDEYTKLSTEINELQDQILSTLKKMSSVDTLLKIQDKPIIYFKFKQIMKDIGQCYAIEHLTKLSGKTKQKFDSSIKKLMELINKNDEDAKYILDLLEGSSYGRYLEFIQKNLDNDIANNIKKQFYNAQQSYNKDVSELKTKYDDTLKKISNLEETLEQTKKDVDKLKRDKLDIEQKDKLQERLYKADPPSKDDWTFNLNRHTEVDEIDTESLLYPGVANEVTRIKSIQNLDEEFINKYADDLEDQLKEQDELIKNYIETEKQFYEKYMTSERLYQMFIGKYREVPNPEYIPNTWRDGKQLTETIKVENKLQRIDKIIPTRDEKINQNLYIQFVNGFKGVVEIVSKLDVKVAQKFLEDVQATSNIFVQTSAAGSALYKVYEFFNKRAKLLNKLTSKSGAKGYRFVGNVYNETIDLHKRVGKGLSRHQRKMFSAKDVKYILSYIDIRINKLQKSIELSKNKYSKQRYQDKIDKLNWFAQELKSIKETDLELIEESRFEQFTKIVDEYGNTVPKNKSIPLLVQDIYSIKDLNKRLDDISGNSIVPLIDNLSNRANLRSFIDTMRHHLTDKHFESVPELKDLYIEIVERLEKYYKSLGTDKITPITYKRAIDLFYSIYTNLDRANKLMVMNGLRNSLMDGINELPKVKKLDEEIQKLQGILKDKTKELDTKTEGLKNGTASEHEVQKLEEEVNGINYEIRALQEQKSRINKITIEGNKNLYTFNDAFKQILKEYNLDKDHWYLDNVSVDDIIWEYVVYQCKFNDVTLSSDLLSNPYRLKEFYTNVSGLVKSVTEIRPNNYFINTLNKIMSALANGRFSDNKQLEDAQKLIQQLIEVRDFTKNIENGTKFRVKSFYKDKKIYYTIVDSGLEGNEITKVNKALKSVIEGNKLTLEEFKLALRKEGIDPELLGYTDEGVQDIAFKQTNASDVVNKSFKITPYAPKQRTLLHRRVTSNKNPKYVYSLDIETSDKGLSEGGKPLITQLAITKIDLETGETTKVYNKYINPDDYKQLTSNGKYNSNKEALKIGGNPLDESWVEHKLDWVTLEQMKTDFFNLKELWNDDSIVIAHNGNFDMSVIMNNFTDTTEILDQSGLIKSNLYSELGFDFNFTDSLALARIYNPNYKNTNMELAKHFGVEYDELYDVANEFDEKKIKQTGLFVYFFREEDGGIASEIYFNGKSLHDAGVDTEVTSFWTKELFNQIIKNAPENVNLFDILQNPYDLGKTINMDNVDESTLINLSKLLRDEDINTKKIRYREEIDEDEEYQKFLDKPIVDYIVTQRIDNIYHSGRSGQYKKLQPMLKKITIRDILDGTYKQKLKNISKRNPNKVALTEYLSVKNVEEFKKYILTKEQYISKYFPNKPKYSTEYFIKSLVELRNRLEDKWDRAELIQELLEDSTYGIGINRIEDITIYDILEVLDGKREGQAIENINKSLDDIEHEVSKALDKNEAEHKMFLKVMNPNFPTATLMKNRNWVRLQLMGNIACDDDLRVMLDILSGNTDNLTKFKFTSSQSFFIKVFAQIKDNPSVDRGVRFLRNIIGDANWEDEIMGIMGYDNKQSIDLFYQCMDRARKFMKNNPNLDEDTFRNKLLFELQSLVVNKFNKKSYLSSEIINRIVNKVTDKYLLNEDFALYDNAANFTNNLYDIIKQNILDPISESMRANEDFPESDIEMYNEIYDVFRDILTEYRKILRDVKTQNALFKLSPIDLRDFIASSQLRPSELLRDNYEEVLKLSNEVRDSNKLKQLSNSLFEDLFKPYDDTQTKFYVDARETRNIRILTKIASVLGYSDLREFMRITRSTNFRYINKDFMGLIWDDILRDPEHRLHKFVVDMEVEFRSFNEDSLSYINDIDAYINRIKSIFVVNLMEQSDIQYERVRKKLINIEAIKDSNNLFRNICNIYGTNAKKISKFLHNRSDLVLVYADPHTFKISKMDINEVNITKILQSKNLDSFALLPKDNYYKTVNETQPIQLPNWLSALHKYLILPTKLFSLHLSIPFLVSNMGSAYLQNINANGGNPVTAISDLVNMAKHYIKWKDVYIEATSNKQIWKVYGNMADVEGNWYDYIINADKEFLDTLDKDSALYKFITESTEEEREMFVKISDYSKTNATYSEVIDVQRNIVISEKKKKELEVLKEKAENGNIEAKEEYDILKLEPNDGYKTIEEEFAFLKQKKNKIPSEWRRYHILKNKIDGKFGDMMSNVYKYTGLQKWLDINADIENIFRMAMMDNLMKSGSDFSSATNEVIRRHFIYNDKSEFDRLLEVFMPFSTYPIKAANLFSELAGDASFVKMMYLYNKYSWGDEDESRSDYLQKRKVRGDVPFGNQLLGLGNAFTESLYTLMNPVESINNKLNPLLKPMVDLATNAQYNRITQLPLVSHGANIADTIQSAKQSGTFNAGQLLGMSRTYYRYDNNYYNKPRYPQRSYLYKNLYTKGGYSRVAMGMQQTTLDNLQYRVSDILYKTRYRHK